MDRFWNKVDKTDDCWLWTASTREGYGAFKVNGKVVGAHRFIWEYTHNVCVLPKIDVCHTCDVKLCVRLDHLFLGTRKDNMIDCVKKHRIKTPDRNRFQPGDRHPGVKIADSLIHEVKHRYETESISLRELGEEYSVDHSRIWQIVRGAR